MVRFEDVVLRYPAPPEQGPAIEALRGISFTLPGGSFHWLVGPSGAGKSSMLRLMQLALRASGGEVVILGHPVSRLRRADLPRLRRRIGIVPQDLRLLPYLSAFDNVALPLRIAGRAEAALRADVTEMLRWAGLGARMSALPASLSGGEQQRLAIARAIVIRPALLLADEPTGQLDQQQAERTVALLREMHRLGTTVLVATHATALVEAFPGPVLQLEAGRLAAHG
jgi:cell division transport system ATP-binding protein